GGVRHVAAGRRRCLHDLHPARTRRRFTGERGGRRARRRGRRGGRRRALRAERRGLTARVIAEAALLVERRALAVPALGVAAALRALERERHVAGGRGARVRLVALLEVLRREPRVAAVERGDALLEERARAGLRVLRARGDGRDQRQRQREAEGAAHHS